MGTPSCASRSDRLPVALGWSSAFGLYARIACTPLKQTGRPWMNLRRSFDRQPGSIRLVAGLACWLTAATLSAQSYRPRHAYAPAIPAYRAPAGVAPAYYAQPMAAPPMAVPAGYRSPLLSTPNHPQYPYCPPGQQPPGYMP